MANQSFFFSATMQKSALSKPARVMNELNLDRVAYFVLRGGSDDQRAYLNELLGDSLIARLPLLRGRNRQMLICRAELHLSDAQVLCSYQAVLTHVFGERCRITTRIMWRGGDQ
ncbi:MAG: hypothetical protein ACI4BD_02570 [Paludibacteraceae bacterium]